jgi:hypothetical protein
VRFRQRLGESFDGTGRFLLMPDLDAALYAAHAGTNAQARNGSRRSALAVT